MQPSSPHPTNVLPKVTVTPRFGLGRRLWLAFSVVIACSAVGGVLSVASNQSATHQTDQLVAQTFPHKERVAAIQVALLRAALGLRVYGVTFHQPDLAAGREQLLVAKAETDALRALCRHAATAVVAEHEAIAAALVQLDTLVDQTETLVAELVATQTVMADSIAGASPVFQEHRGRMQAKLASEIAGGAGAEEISSRAAKLATTNEAEQLFQRFVRAVYQGLALRDPTQLDLIGQQLPPLLESLQRLRKQHSKVDDWARVDQLTTRTAAFGAAAARTQSGLVSLNAVNRQRAELVGHLIARLAGVDQLAGSQLVGQVGVVQRAMAHSLWAISGSAALAIIIGITASVLLTRQVVGPVRRTTAALAQVADGDLSACLTVGSTDELGLMAAGLNSTVERLRHHRLATGEVANALHGQAQTLNGSSQNLSNLAQQTASQAAEVTQAAEQVRVHVSTVATAAEEMSTSVHDIARSSAEAAQVTTEARQLSQHAQGVIAKLSSSSTQISTVAKDIEAIAQKTNLLALNATIEAASAGEAGRGFAVVANEVKDLARQTAVATADITKRIQEIQTGTAAAVSCLGDIATIIGKIDGFEQSISAAVQQQASTTDAITRTATEAAQLSQAIVGNIQLVAKTIGSTTRMAADISSSALQLTSQAGQLQSLVNAMRLESPASATLKSV